MAVKKSDYISIPDKNGWKQEVQNAADKLGLSMACFIRTVVSKYMHGELIEKKIK